MKEDVDRMVEERRPKVMENEKKTDVQKWAKNIYV